jgi:hypothetical protein
VTSAGQSSRPGAGSVPPRDDGQRPAGDRRDRGHPPRLGPRQTVRAAGGAVGARTGEVREIREAAEVASVLKLAEQTAPCVLLSVCRACVEAMHPDCNPLRLGQERDLRLGPPGPGPGYNRKLWIEVGAYQEFVPLDVAASNVSRCGLIGAGLPRVTDPETHSQRHDPGSRSRAR